jgi:transglutaminase-like putative cysteine protease
MTSAPSSTEITDPRHVRHLKIRLTGINDKALVLNDKRQKTVYTDGASPHADYDITASEFSHEHSLLLPIRRKSLASLLSDTPYVQPSDPEIRKVANGVRGSEKNAYIVATRLREWVYTNMHPKGNIGIVRSSVDVLHAKTGVCRDYAVLYAALARSAGIPTRLVSGLIYWKSGFYYHAWAEVFVGEWAPMDSTLPTDFVDATHIKLAEGDATAMFSMVKAIGSIKAEVEEFH